MQTDIFVIQWRGPYRLDRFFEYAQANHKGLYMVSRVFGGRESLRYIGMTWDQTVSKRLEQHPWLWEERGEVRVRVSEIEVEPGKRLTKKRLMDIERLLIFFNKPARNTQHYDRYNVRRRIILRNAGRRGPLPDVEVSALSANMG